MAQGLGPDPVTPSGLSIRLGRPDDAAMLAELAARTFREAFGAMNRPEDLAVHLATTYGPARQAAELADPGITVLVPELDGAPAGYAMLRQGSYRPEAVTGPDPIELWRFYVEPRWIGGGVAQPLMAAVKQAARDRGGRTLWLGVWERNPRGIAFYRKSGFTAVGTHIYHVGSDPQTDVVMVHSLEPA